MRIFFFVCAIIFYEYLCAQVNNVETPTIKNIREIVLKPALDVMRISRDTIEYKIGPNLDPEIFKVEDLFKHFLGFSVTEDGKIFYNGTEISVVMIDGDPLSFYDYGIITKHLNAGMFSSVELIQEYQANRFESMYSSKNEIALNLKMKKAFLNRFNTDISAKATSPKGIYSKAEMNRIGGYLKSIANVEKNILGDRWAYVNNATKDQQQYHVSQISFLEHPFLFQSNLFKQKYLINNRGYRLQMLNAITLGSYSKIRIETTGESIHLDIKEDQKMNFYLGEQNTPIETRNTHVNLFNENRSIKLMFDHDHYKNNRGEYKIFFIKQKLNQWLQDTIENGLKIINHASDGQRRNILILEGGEKYFIKKKFLLETSIQAASNHLNRLLEGTVIGKDMQNLLQQYVSTDVRLSFKQNKHIFHAGYRMILEDRELYNTFNKKYIYLEHLYRINKKIHLNYELFIGKGIIASPVIRYAKMIYIIEGEGVYKKSNFNKFFLKYAAGRKIPTIDTWLINPLVQLSGYMQYHPLPDRFSFIKKIELGKSYQHLYRGFGYYYSLASNTIQNDARHSIGFQLVNMIDTITYSGSSHNLQVLAQADQFIFPLKIRISTAYQYTVTQSNQGMFGKIYAVQLNNQSIKISCKTSWEKSFQWDFSISMQQHISKNGFSKNTIYSYNHQLNTKYKIGQKLYTAIQSTVFQTQRQSLYFLLDILCQIRATKQLQISITALNLLNIQQFKQKFVSNYGVQAISTPLAGRKIEFEIKKSF